MNPSASGRGPDAEPPVVAEGVGPYRWRLMVGTDDPSDVWAIAPTDNLEDVPEGYKVLPVVPVDAAAVERAAREHERLHREVVEVGWDAASGTYSCYVGGKLAATGFESVAMAAKGCHGFIAECILGAAGEEGART